MIFKIFLEFFLLFIRFLLINNQMSSEQSKPKSLSFGNLYNHFFLLHDFFHRLTKMKGKNAEFFDLQIEINNGMKSAVSTGSKLTQLVTFGSLCTYFMKGNSIKLRFVYGFLFMYWYNHIITLGSYLGAFCRIPNIYSKTARYYQNHKEQPNPLVSLEQFMAKENHYEEPQLILGSIFGQEDEEKTFVSNEFFVKNKEKYLPKEVLEYNSHNEKKLKYMDSFLTRYIYYSFARWWTKVCIVFSLESPEE